MLRAIQIAQLAALLAGAFILFGACGGVFLELPSSSDCQESCDSGADADTLPDSNTDNDPGNNAGPGTDAEQDPGTEPDPDTSQDPGSDPGSGVDPGDDPDPDSNSEWPQCYASDTVPTGPLKQRAPSSDYQETFTNGGIAMLIGPQRPSCLTDEVITRDLEALNKAVTDVVEILGFPAFADWDEGYYLNWVILNSGIPGASIGGEGGYQGNRWGHMNFESSQQCPCTWDDYNEGAALHECIHALQAELWVFNNEASGWIHEAHNCYLGTMREQLAHNKYTMGWGAAAALQMPHVPIESMGLLANDVVAGPADQHAAGNSYVDSIVRYGLEIFFLSLNLEMGRGFINCLWTEASPGNSKSLFQVMQGYAGAEGVAHAVLSFGSRSSILDFGAWTEAVRDVVRDHWNRNWWFYYFPSGDGTTEFGPSAKQIPHHQGRNIIPIELDSGATSVTVELKPDSKGSGGTPLSMTGQLTYRTPGDEPVYGEEFSDGQSTIQVPNGARNGIVNFVIAVTNPNAESGSDDGSNKGFDGQEHFGYSARIVSGGKVAPSSTVPW